ncbi:hypothetical protein ABMY26_23665 [Azospirillum sp. HJ39]|uniref:hypothetical protein n=1 Tax=Azospirillum sp. HJ39 TaxID=3159496 RepID=UPI0035592E09
MPRDIPIIFSAPMIQALLAERKTQTRRIIKKPAALNALDVFGPSFLLKPGNVDLIRFAVGDRLWVRESVWQNGTWVRDEDETGEIGSKWVGTASVRMMADEEKPAGSGNFVWRSIPSIHMPLWASRLTLVVEEVRVQRLHDISETDAIAEGVEMCSPRPHGMSGWRDYGDKPEDTSRRYFSDPRKSFQSLWTSINGPSAWDANPFVVALTFQVHRCNIDYLDSNLAALEARS